MVKNKESEFLLELYSEEIPARFQLMAGRALLASFIKKLAGHGIVKNEQDVIFFVGPRRLTLYAPSLPLETEAKIIDKKGPKIDARIEALEGFLKAANVRREDLVIKEISGQKHYIIEEQLPSQQVKDLLPSIITEMIDEFIWPKSMRWGSSELKWVRPLRNILCVFNSQAVEFSVHGLFTNNLTFGHFFIDRGSVSINNFAEYKQLLLRLHVMFDHRERKQFIMDALKNLEQEYNIILIKDEDLIDEVTGIVELPNIILGEIDQEYRFLPDEVLISTIRTNQKYFCFREKSGKLSNYFAICANSLSTIDNVVREGNLRVLRARLKDAVYFFENDKKQNFKSLSGKLTGIIFHNKLGTMAEKTKRIEFIATKIAEKLLTGKEHIAREAASICKNDLVTEMVAEFPELQGIMGSYYAQEAGFNQEISLAIREHYLPINRDSAVPSSNTGIVLALADKIDSLYGLFYAGEKPTGSKDQFSLRRAMIGIIKILLERKIDMSILSLITFAGEAYKEVNNIQDSKLEKELKDFCLDRFISFMKDAGYGHELISATSNNFISPFVCFLKIIEIKTYMENELFTLVQVPALARLLSFKTGESNSEISLAEFNLPEEKALAHIAFSIKTITLDEIIKLAEPINNFFDKIMVNDPNEDLKNKRVGLVRMCQKIVLQYADFGMLKG